MKRTALRNEDGVSPVIGVMLMIVVTIIIAAVVSGFAGGMTSSESKVPNAAFTVHPNLKGNGTIAFHHVGGDELVLNEILVQLEHNSTSIILSNLDEMTGHTNYPYLTKMGGDADKYADRFITGGDRLVLTCDYNDPTEKEFVFKPAGAAANFTIHYSDHIKYMILDKESAKAIQTGEFVLR
jgi:FlaG/FlaF family flagellin (archaellin)